VQSGTLRISADGTGSGPFTADTGATLEFGAGSSYQLDANATVGGLGTVLLKGHLDSSANWNVDGITNVSAGTVNFLAPATTRRAVHAGGRINGDLLIHELFTWQDGVAGNGTTVLEGDADISGSGQTGHILDNRILNLAAGHVVNLLAQMIGMDATVNNPAGATFNMSAPLLRFTPPAAFNNNGNFIKISPSNSNLEWTFVNAGLFDLTEGNVQVTTSFTQTAGQMRLSGGTIGASVPLQIQGGQLTGAGQINAPVSNDATIAPGSPIGTLVFNLPLMLGSNSVLSFDIGGRAQGTEYDFISPAGQSLALNGQLQLQFLNGFEASVTETDVFILLEACPQCLSGSFANAASGSDLPTSDGLGSFTVLYGPTSPFPPNQVVITNFARR
jgi:hypothetical protein